MFIKFKFWVVSFRSRGSSDCYDDLEEFGSEILGIGWIMMNILIDFKYGMCYSNMGFVWNGVIVDMEVKSFFIVVGYL